MSVTSGGVGAFCPDPLWDANLTWNTDSPDFTACFHQEQMSRPTLKISFLPDDLVQKLDCALTKRIVILYIR